MVPFGIHSSALLAFTVRDAFWKVLTSIKEFFCQEILLWHALAAALAAISVLELLRVLKLWQRVLIALAVCLLILLLLNWGQGKEKGNGPTKTEPPGSTTKTEGQNVGVTSTESPPKKKKVTVTLERELFTVEVKWEKEKKRITGKNYEDLCTKLCDYLEQLAKKFPIEIEVHENKVGSSTSNNVRHCLGKLAGKNPQIHYNAPSRQ